MNSDGDQYFSMAEAAEDHDLRVNAIKYAVNKNRPVDGVYWFDWKDAPRVEAAHVQPAQRELNSLLVTHL